MTRKERIQASLDKINKLMIELERKSKVIKKQDNIIYIKFGESK